MNSEQCKEYLENRFNMTNGEMLKKVFPKLQIREESTMPDFVTYSLDGIVGTCVERKWWDAPYRQEEVEE